MSSITIAIIGLGYVGLPLAVEFAKKYKVIGFDINQDRVSHLQQGNDSTLEVTTEELLSVLRDSNQAPDKTGLFITTDTKALAEANYYIVTVPTPTDKNNRPDLTPLIKATETIAKHLKPNDTVIYESTVYPGATEEVCVPILTKISRLTYATNSTQHSTLQDLLTANSQDFTQHSALSHNIVREVSHYLRFLICPLIDLQADSLRFFDFNRLNWGAYVPFSTHIQEVLQRRWLWLREKEVLFCSGGQGSS